VQVGVVAFVAYISVHIAAHVLFNLPFVNLQLVARGGPLVAEAAVARIGESGDREAVAPLQQKLLEEIERQGFGGTTLLDALTQVGGARGWQDLLESGRLGVADRDARAWQAIIQSVRQMSNPYYAEARGGVKSRYLRDEDIEQLFDQLALKLAEHLKASPDGEASLTLLAVMKDRPDLCLKYLELVPNGLRGSLSQAAYDVVRTLDAMKNPSPPGGPYHPGLSREEIVRIGREQVQVADEWAAWTQSKPPVCRLQ
jgi:hypothetical protein